MRMFHLIIGVATLIGTATSCDEDSTLGLNNPEDCRISMSVSLPQDMVNTRAVPTAPEGHKLRCIIEIWKKDGSSPRTFRKELVQTGTENFKFELDIKTQGEYKALLWADYIDADATATGGYFTDKYYTTTDLKRIVVKTLTAADPSHRDAFMVMQEFKKETGALSLSATLTRVLTKVVIAEKSEENYNLCANVKATYQVPSVINLFSENIATSTLLIDAIYNAPPQGGTVNVNGQECHILFSDYILANVDGTLGDIQLEFTSNDATKTFPSIIIPNGIPAKRNYNILAAGKLIQPSDAPSTKVEMNVSIHNDFTGEEEQEFTPRVDKVGYYYLKDGSLISRDATLTSTQKSNCIGIVFWIDPTDPTKGKIVSLKELKADWYEAQIWITGNNLPSGVSWKFPTKEELQHLYCAYTGVTPITWETGACPSIGGVNAKNTFNNYLINAGGTKLLNDMNGRYWSSTILDDEKMWLMQTDNGKVNTNPKNYTEYVRAIASF